MDVRAFRASNSKDRCAIMFEVACDWNYAATVICSESAFIFRARQSIFDESAFFASREKIVS
jgi:hypothetical protein